MLSVAICEDDLVQQEILKALLDEMGYTKSLEIQTFSSGEELIQSYKEGNRYSIIFLDVKMKGLNGIQTAKLIKAFDRDCLFIIITSIIEYALEGYSISAYDFILKPIEKEKFQSVVNRAVREWQSNMAKVYIINSRNKLTSIKLSQIRYIESNKNRVLLHTCDGTFIDHTSMKNLEPQMADEGFVRISRYYIVNLSHIKEISANAVILINGKELAYSGKYRDMIKKEYLNHLTGGL